MADKLPDWLARQMLDSVPAGPAEVRLHTGPPRGTGAFAADLRTAAADEQLSEALAGLHRVAEAAGIFEQTWQAGSIGEVCDMLAAWCRDRRAGARALTQITVSSRPDRPRVVATHPDDGTYWVREIAFPEGQAVTLAEIVAEFEDSNHLPRARRHG
jgi:hypothetical protein